MIKYIFPLYYKTRKTHEINYILVDQMKKVDIIVARYNENIEWVNKVKSTLSKDYHVRVFIYNKGPDNIENFEYEQLENHGRESHTYLHHIVTHYDEYIKEPRILVFLQGAFWDHAQTWYKGYIDESDLISAFIRDTDKQGASISWARTHDYVGNNAAHYNFHIRMHNQEELYPLSKECFGEWFTKNIGCDFPQHKLLYWWISGLFSVNASLLTSQHSKEYYSFLLNQLVHKNPEIGHFFERSWVYITGACTLLPENIKLYAKSKTGFLL
jgi:hypothetical protein